jgi:hypothetical protein
MLLASLIELVAVPVAIWRLTSNDFNRTTRNVAFTTLGAICLLPGLAVYLYAMYAG